LGLKNLAASYGECARYFGSHGPVVPRLKNKIDKNQNAINDIDTLCHRGFTLIELTVVITLISIIFFVTLPRIKNDIFVDQTKKTSRWLLTSVRYLKEASIRDQVDHALNVDMEDGKIWVSHASMAEEKLEKSETGGLTLSDGIRVLDVEFAGNRKMTNGVVQIQFYAKGYSDNAMIHVVNEDDRELSYHITPFLPRMKIIEGYVGLEE
jgi:prepilin-type N-terminal cleavage/methylation domain-containing protein